jgi:putative oxidoreductase
MSILAPSPWASRMLSILRIVAALLFLLHGTNKLLGYPPNPSMFPPMSIPLMSLPGIAGILEIVGGTLLILGLFTRPVAFLHSGEMAVAYFMAHFPNAFWPLTNLGEAAVLYCFIWLYFAFAGGGAWSLDNVLASRRAAVPST